MLRKTTPTKTKYKDLFPSDLTLSNVPYTAKNHAVNIAHAENIHHPKWTTYLLISWLVDSGCRVLFPWRPHAPTKLFPSLICGQVGLLKTKHGWLGRPGAMYFNRP
jgi:hypothetical protein